MLWGHEPIFMVGPKPMLTEFGIHYILESSLSLLQCESNEPKKGNTECKVFDGNGWMSEELRDVVMYHFS